MDSTVIGILFLDGITNGAIYALLALALVLVFTVTRVIFIPQGEFVTFGALTMAMLQLGTTPGTVWLLLALASIATLMEIAESFRQNEPLGGLLRRVAATLLIPGIASGLVIWAAPRQFPLAVQALLTLLVVTPLGPLTYRLAYQSLTRASVLVLMIVSVGVHFALTGLGLLFFGAEGFRNSPFWDQRFDYGALLISGQSITVILTSAALIVLLALFFGRTFYGKALRATAVNRLGAQLVGISAESAGKLSFAMAAFIGGLSGVLVGPLTTIFYDTGFLIGLIGFVGAIFGGLASYPAAAAGAIIVGLLQSFGSFWASDYKEVIVFTSIIPVLLWRSLGAGSHHDDEGG